MKPVFLAVALLTVAHTAVAQRPIPVRPPTPVRAPVAPAPVVSPARAAAPVMSPDFLRSFGVEAFAYAPAMEALVSESFMAPLISEAMMAPHQLPARFEFQPEWNRQDPADSLYRVAHEAMNRGDWRRAADLFAQVQTRFPQSSRLIAAAYYEAFTNYRIGSVESLRSALRILTEKTKGATTSSTRAEIASLTTRVRGALAARGDQSAAAALANAAGSGQPCDREDIQVRVEALSALAQADMASATPMLQNVLNRRDPCALELRRRALSILLRRADTAATSAAISVARNNEEHINLRTDAISFLSRLPGDNAIAALQELLRTSEDANVQRAAVRSLARSDNARARQAVRTLIERTDVSEQLRAEALSSFTSERSSADDAAYLRSLYPRLAGERLRNSAINAMARIGGEENEQFLLGIARNGSESSETRATAISRLAKVESISLAEWQRLYESAESRSIRSNIIRVYGQRKEPEAIDRLADIIQRGTDPTLRRYAINALRLKDDPRARKIIQDVIDG